MMVGQRTEAYEVITQGGEVGIREEVKANLSRPTPEQSLHPGRVHGSAILQPIILIILQVPRSVEAHLL